MLLVLPATAAFAQVPATEWPDQPEIYFPQAPTPGKWRKSIGAVFTTTPPELTEEVRVSVPAIDFNVQRGLTKHLYLTTRIQTQIVQSNVSVGLRWATPLTDRLHMSVGYDLSGWFGALKIKDVFNSQAYGAQSLPSLSVGYRLTRDLEVTLRSEAIMDLYYRSKVGTLAVVYDRRQINGVAFTVMLEQPFYNNQHVSVGFRAAYSNFNWQLWSLYDTFDRNLLYPQLIFGFIL
ncbi:MULTISPECIES: hypothetical protein [Spirosoma]|uniref:Outer membrane beta-barrel protein n=1 Tax=Spirosoma liriopis TaxID=2937440 RepID=A0ABT0HHK8_9BACT|nr:MULTISPECIES: hypothetical protein [Spirosoma]MCK8491652.1 hypothetical protein [Spirosoma liriopis]UHG91013.1 hypothetical protein LQ777_22570 [Spirosoma oryzicola]